MTGTMAGAAADTPTSDDTKCADRGLRELSVRAGGLLTLAVCLVLATRLLIRDDETHATAQAALVLAAAVSGLAVLALPAPRIVRSRWCEPFFLAWSALEVGLLLALVVLDGGARSPLAPLLAIPVAFAAVSYPLGSVVAVGALSVGGYLLVGLAEGAASADTVVLLVAALAGTAVTSTWQAREAARQRRRLHELASTDALTGAVNRRGFEEHLRRGLTRSAAGGPPIAVLLLDLDAFKAHNDEHGHAAGDELLRWVVRAAGRLLRPHDMVARLGGDEFAVVVSGVGPETAATLGTRLRTVLAERAPVSVGVAVAPADGHDPDRIVQTADERLFADKRDRRRSAPC
jgi:diguanylate cyclase (GGDEF)-like protein